MNKPVKLLTAKDCAGFANVTPKTIVRWAQTGEYGFPQPAIDAYHSKRWHPQDIEKWLKRIQVS